jgi:hypothetical protein
MNLLTKFKETSISVVPILLIVLVLELTVAPIGATLLAQFFLGGVFIIIGLSVFLLGIDLGVLPVGQKVGATLVYKRNLGLMLAVGFIVGFFITVAEPDVRVLAGQAATVDPSISKTLLVVMISLGVGLFVALGFGRTILGIPYRYLLIVFYIGVFILASLTDPAYLGVGFDAGGATTGPMTVPFIMALGVGVAAVRKGKQAEDDSFGMVGLASIGPIAAVLIMGIITRDNRLPHPPPVAESVETRGIVRELHPSDPRNPRRCGAGARSTRPHGLRVPDHASAHAATSGGPHDKGSHLHLSGPGNFFIGGQRRLSAGGSTIGGIIGAMEHNAVLIPIGFVLGAVVVLAEPAIWVLNNQVEEVSGGYIKKRVMLISLSIGVAVAVALAMLRVVSV